MHPTERAYSKARRLKRKAAILTAWCDGSGGAWRPRRAQGAMWAVRLEKEAITAGKKAVRKVA